MAQKVLFTASTYSHIRNFHLPYLRAFQEQGWEVHVGCANAPDTIPGADAVIPLPFEKKMHAPSNFRAARILRRRIREERYDLITTHTSLAAFFTRLAVLGMKDRPRVVNMAHGYLFDDATNPIKKQILLSAERLTAPVTDLLLTMNRWDFEAARKYRLGHHVVNVPGIGVDFSRLDQVSREDGLALRRSLGVAENAFVLIYAAEFSARKSQNVLIRAMRDLPEEVILVLPGQGALLDECRSLAVELGVDNRILFPGHINDMPLWYAMADAAVSASRSEGLPFNIMEAMYASLPVIASAVKGHEDLIVHGETGLLYPYGDSAACAEAVKAILASPETAAAYAAAAHDSMGQYSAGEVIPQVLAAYLDGLPAERSTANV